MARRKARPAARRTSDSQSFTQILWHNKATIIDLPNELLDYILERVGDRDLLAVAVLCTRLNSVAIPIYLGRMKVTGASVILSQWGTPFHALKGVRLSLKLQHLAYLSCTFTMNASEEIKEVQKLVEKVSSIGHIALVFCKIYTNSRIFSSALKTLLDSLQGKSCHGFHATSNAGSPVHNRPIHAKPLVDLTSFSVDSSSNFLSSSFKDWTIQTLNSSPITSLHLSDDQTDLPDSLALVELPRLTNLNISSSVLSVVDLAAFLNRHPSIVSLEVALQQYQISRDTPICLLPHVSSVKAAPEFITYLLSSAEAVPRLYSVELSYHSGQGPFKSSGLRKACAMIAQRDGIRSLSLALVSSPQMKKWLRLGKSASIEKHRLHHITSLVVHQIGVFDLLPQWLRRFPSLRTLTIRGIGGIGWLTTYNIGAFVPVPETASKKASFVKSVHETLPTLEFISFD